MTTEETQKMPALGRDGEQCEQCGSPLAADQRYCLNCGRRRGAPRVEYQGRVGPTTTGDAPAPATGPAAAAPEPVPAEKGQRDYAPLAAVGGIAVLGLMLLIGVLIGRGDGDSAPAPVPVVVQGGGGAAGGGTAGSGGGEGGEGGAALGSSGGGKSEGVGGKGGKGGGKAETAADAGAVTASEDQLEELQSETGEDAAKNALKLPDKIATPGAPPPIDKSKPPGGGEGGGLVIK